MRDRPHAPPIVRSRSGGLSSWWGKISTLDPVTGRGTATPAVGTYPDLVEVTGGQAVDVIVGVEAMHLCPALGDCFALFVPSGPGVLPAWTALHHIRTGFEPPTELELAELQDNPSQADCA